MFVRKCHANGLASTMAAPVLQGGGAGGVRPSCSDESSWTPGSHRLLSQADYAI